MIYIVLPFLLIASESFATTYYVSKTASNGYAVGNNGNSCAQAQNKATPKNTLAAGSGCLASGDTLMVNEGTYTEEILNPIAGSASAYTTIKADPASTRPIIDPDGVALKRGLYCSNGASCHHIRLEGFEVTTAYNSVSLQTNGTNGYPHHVQLVNNIFHDTIHTNVFIISDSSGSSTDMLIQGNEFYRTGARYTDIPGNVNPYGPRHNTIYGVGNNGIVERNVFHDLANGVGIWGSGSTQSNNIIRYNEFYNIGNESLSTWLAGASGSYACVHISVPGGGHQIYGNICRKSGTSSNSKFTGVRVGTQATGDLGDIVNNSFYDLVGDGYGVDIIKGTADIKNNICYSCSHTFRNGTQSNNLTSNPSFKDAANGDLSLLAGSAAIGAGANVGLACNGTCDIGAFQTIKFSSCQVPASATSTIQITIQNNAAPPLGNTLTTFTARRDGVSNPLTGAASKIGDNVVSLPLTNAYSGGQTADISWSSGGLTDSSLIGNQWNQPYITPLTNQSCTNNAAGAPVATLTQAAYMFRGVYGLEANPDVRQTENVATFTTVQGGAHRIRFSVVCDIADCAPEGFYLRYAQGGGYSVIPDSFGGGNIAFCGSTYTGGLIPTNGTPTTDQLSTGGTFVPGAVVFTSNAIPTVALATGYKTELEYCLRYSQSATGDYTYRLYTQTGSALSAYTNTPTVTIVHPQASAF